ncbi:hypothetical protein AXG93_2091s1120 [Marchantia polymorpha subsp. ruderalis]|uniref:Uncharacterized protein n=1 Tax=Marchantia polymorpha subsp. ruderalis TaxID=1480154 RepID=A0A176W8H4_MARPO|nr:hypothetical protein AXG93_2091s1120 [Marchantia polymorpha subsp. ruderalis]
MGSHLNAQFDGVGLERFPADGNCVAHNFERVSSCSDGSEEGIRRLGGMMHVRADPTFMLFGPSFDENHWSTEERSKSLCSSLLVITSDGRVWLLDCAKESDSALERPSKKKRETVPEELQKALQEVMFDECDFRPLHMGKSSQEECWEDLEDVANHGSQMPGQRCSGGPIKRAEHKMKEFDDRQVGTPSCKESINPTLFSSFLVDSNPQWEKVSSDTFPRFDNKLKVKSVSQEALLTYVPGTLVAAFGPKNCIALLGVTGTLKVLQVSSRGLHQSTLKLSDATNFRSTDEREPSCLLYACVRSHCRAYEQPEGNVASLDAKFFENLFGKFDIMVSPFGILHGDTKGRVYASLLSSELSLSCHRLLCELSQPIVAILIVSAIHGFDRKRDYLEGEDHVETLEHDGHSLLIIGMLGKIILITGTKELVEQKDDGPFWPPSNNFSWRCKTNTLTGKQLNQQNLEFVEWEVSSPITSACMLGPHRLCYCSRSELYYADLFHSVDGVQIYPHHSKTRDFLSAEVKDTPSVSHLRSSQNPQSSMSYNLAKETYVKELISHKVPVADVVAKIAGRGVCGGGGSSRPLVALTTRGRLLGVEVSNHVSSRALGVAGGIPKSLRSLQSRMEERIQGLLQRVDEVSKSTDLMKSHSASITIALTEMANASQIVKELCSEEIKMRRPDISLYGEPPKGKLSSFLTVTECSPVIISPESLSFSPGTGKSVPFRSFQSRRAKFVVRLCNKSLRVLSPYWSLLVELQSANSDHSVIISLLINRGLGLPVGGQFTQEFITQLPGKGLGPVNVSLFLCHHQISHHLIVKSQLTLLSSTEALINTAENEMDSGPAYYLTSNLQRNVNGLGLKNTGSIAANQASGGVCILLSQYRVDVLSLSQTAPAQLGLGSMVELKMAQKNVNLDSIHCRLFEKFSSKITLTSLKSTPYSSNDSKETVRFWRDFYLDDLLEKGFISKAGKQISLLGYDSETFSISTNVGNVGEECPSFEIMLESSSLLVGALVREALMWRLDHSKCNFSVKEYCPWKTTENVVNSLASEDTGDETLINSPAEIFQEGSEEYVSELKPMEISDTVTELDQRLAVIFDLWEDVLRSPESVEFTSVLNETCTTIQEVMVAYRTCREDRLDSINITSKG